ncbi:sulfatase family protein [Caulobacter sp. NIBR2454]|uniref:sulfatase family protein n=1 Tax=Caulobacter sp. NIBR2454 TaxID=3015996 RepID=UPI0022B71A8E|nr:sulfatase [Caulobacter sp. NIBR2454]
MIAKVPARALFAALCLGAALVFGADARAQSATRPNIVMIVSDDHGRDDIGAYGSRTVRTPHIDALAREGLRFDNAFAATSSCSPSRATILTGRMNHNTGMYGLEHEESHFSTFDDVQSLPVRLKTAGYRTARVGKFHVAPQAVFAFDEVLSQGQANQTVSLARSPAQMVEKAQAFVSERSNAPFFLYFATDDPHRAFPFSIGDQPNSFGNRADGYPGVTEQTYDPSKVSVPAFLPDTPAVRDELAQYYQSISRLDQGVGRLVALLKHTGHYDNTIIVYLTDNGIAFPGAKTTLYDPGVRAPLIMRLPHGAQAGRATDAMVSLADLTPTLLDLAGVAPGRAMDGRSFVSVLKDPAAPGWDEVFGSHTFHEVQMYYPMRSIRTRRWKLIYNINPELTFPFAEDLLYASSWMQNTKSGATSFGQRSVDAFLHRPRFELYDLQSDPGEIRNLADDPAHGAVLADLITRLKAFQTRTRDPWLRKWDFQ